MRDGGPYSRKHCRDGALSQKWRRIHSQQVGYSWCRDYSSAHVLSGQIGAVAAALARGHDANEIARVLPALRIRERFSKHIRTHSGCDAIMDLHLVVEPEHVRQPGEVNPMRPTQVTQSRVSPCLQYSHCGLIILHEDDLHLPFQHHVPKLKGREPFSAQGNTGGDDLRLRGAV